MEFVSPILRGHMLVFRTMGYCTLPPHGNVVFGRVLIFWSLFLSVLFNVMTGVAIFNKDSFLFANDKFGHFNDVLKFVFGDIAVNSAYIMSVWQRSSLYEFWECFGKLQNKCKIDPRFSWRHDIWQNRRFLCIFYAVVSSEFVVMIIFLGLQDYNKKILLFWSFFFPFILAVHLRNMQFILYIEVMRLELEKLKQDIQLLVDYSRFQAYGTGFQGFEEFLRCKILDKQRNYQLIYEMYDHFQRSFGFSIITVLVMIYVRVLVDSYFGYYTIFNGGCKLELILLIPAFFQIPIFLITSKNCMDVVKYITLNLHSIISQFNNQNTIVSVQLQNFSLQILHQNICINGIGITRMDGYMLVKAIGSVTTYMIFFIQFMPKLSTVNPRN